MRTTFMLGMGPTAGQALESLVEHFAVLGLVRPPEPDDPVAKRAAALGIPVFPDCSPRAVAGAINDLDPDCVVVSSYDRILPALLVSDRPFLNVHYAPLPRYRGRATVNWAILRGEPDAAITIHHLAPELDAGNILFQERVAIGPHDTVGDLYERLGAILRTQLGPAARRMLDGDSGWAQVGEPSYGCTRVPEDGLIDWAAPTRDVYALVRALGPPYPGAFTHLDGEPLAIWSARPVADPPRYDGRIPGRVAGRSTSDGWVDVLTGDGVLRLARVRRGAADPQPAAEVITSVRCTLGLRATDLLARIVELEARLAELAREVAAR